MQEPAKWSERESDLSLDVRGGMSALKRDGRAVQSHENRTAQNRFWAPGRHFRMLFAVEDAKIRITMAEYRV
jgi:hypothetical protein